VLYDDAALHAAWDLARHWTVEEHVGCGRLRRGWAQGEICGRTLQDVAKDMIAIARQGLRRRERFSGGLGTRRRTSELEGHCRERDH
jgi:glutamate--cysteine ligase